MTLVWATPMQNHTEKLVALAIADNANDNGVCWPSVTTIARKCDLSEQGVLNRIKSLQKTGWLKVEHKPGCSNTYIINPPTPLTPQQGLPPNAVDHHPPTPLTPPPNAVDPNRNEPSFESSYTTTPQTPPAKPKRTLDESPEFLKFWEAYPRKESKPHAEKAFRKAMKLADLESILKGLERSKEAWKQNDARWIPHPSTWLNGHRWNDEPAKPSQPTQGGKPNWLRIKELKEIIRQLEGQLHSHMDRERNPGKLEQLKAAQAELAKLEPQL